MQYYTYAYLREDGTPYYIGKGKGYRLYDKRHKVGVPTKNRIIYLKQNLTEDEAFSHEIYMIAIFGRKDLGTGILHNKTNGGQGSSDVIRTEEHMNALMKGRVNYIFTDEVKQKISRTLKDNNIKPPSRKGIKHNEEYFNKICKKTYKITNPFGEIFITNRLKTFCKTNNLNFSCMCRVANGVYKQHKKWTVEIVSQST